MHDEVDRELHRLPGAGRHRPGRPSRANAASTGARQVDRLRVAAGHDQQRARPRRPARCRRPGRRRNARPTRARPPATARAPPATPLVPRSHTTASGGKARRARRCQAAPHRWRRRRRASRARRPRPRRRRGGRRPPAPGAVELGAAACARAPGPVPHAQRCPAAASRRAIAEPIRPVPRTATSATAGVHEDLAGRRARRPGGSKSRRRRRRAATTRSTRTGASGRAVEQVERRRAGRSSHTCATVVRTSTSRRTRSDRSSGCGALVSPTSSTVPPRAASANARAAAPPGTPELSMTTSAPSGDQVAQVVGRCVARRSGAVSVAPSAPGRLQAAGVDVEGDDRAVVPREAGAG